MQAWISGVHEEVRWHRLWGSDCVFERGQVLLDLQRCYDTVGSCCLWKLFQDQLERWVIHVIGQEKIWVGHVVGEIPPLQANWLLADPDHHLYFAH